jgi:ectoine hydroxylase
MAIDAETSIEPLADALLTDEQRADFLARGFLIVEGALTRPVLDRLTIATDRVWEEHTPGETPGAPLHLKGFVALDEAFLGLLDHPATFPLVVGLLGWNILLYHCHLDVTPPVSPSSAPRWGWHRDGERIDADLGMRPGPMMSVKIGFFLTDVSEPDRGNLHVIPGSHRWASPPRQIAGERHPAGAVPVLARAGTAFVFDRRLWHARGDNRSTLTRKALFLAYSYRWTCPREALDVPLSVWERLTPVRRQLLGAATSAMGRYVPTPDDVPIRELIVQPPIVGC